LPCGKIREKGGEAPLKKCREDADNRSREEIFMGSSSIHIDCHVCHACYHMDLALFKGAKGIRLRCRKCGNSLDVLNPAGIGSDGNFLNDTSFSRVPSGDRGFEPYVSLDGQEPSTSAEMELTLPAGEPASLSREDGEDEEPGEEIWGNILSELADAHVPLPKSPARARWSPLIILFLLFLFFVGGSAYLIFTKVGKGMLSGIGQNLADTVTFFRS
jgi:hypothetical protein